MNEDLRAVANKKGITLEESLDPAHRELLGQLSKLKGAEFDQLYTKDMVAGHEKAIAQFENEGKTGKDPDVKAWAEKWLPTLREHLALAQRSKTFRGSNPVRGCQHVLPVAQRRAGRPTFRSTIRQFDLFIC